MPRDESSLVIIPAHSVPLSFPSPSSMLQFSHQIALLILINGVSMNNVIRFRHNELFLTLWALAMGLICYNMEWIDKQRWLSSQLLILGVCVPLIIYIGVSVILLYVKVARKLRLLKKLQARTAAKLAKDKKQS